MSNATHEHVIIIGGGPAGLTAAIYTARANLRPIVFAGYDAGGQLQLTTDVENYPGFATGILGPELVAQMRAQAERFGARILDIDVSQIFAHDGVHRVIAEDRSYATRTIVAATGGRARWLGIPGEERLRGGGVSTCATCDGAFFRDAHIVVVGGGDSAMEEALFLTRFGRKVTIVHRGSAFRASKVMSDRVRAHPRVEIVWNTVVEEIEGDRQVEHLHLRHATTGERSRLPADALFVAIGHEPNTATFRGVLDLDDAGYVRCDEYGRTSAPGIFVAGDVYDRRYRQAITAAASGCRAAIEVEHYLSGVAAATVAA